MKVLRSLVIEYNVNPAWFLLGTGNFSYLPEAEEMTNIAAKLEI
ncbi:Dbp [Klebsiella quasipneumoniae subsp. similipneumoniae]|nr:hypothetical protein Kpn23412_5421 [Klebsiella pneumoniae subsp. pneumoniae]AUG88830.1 hypothetical protein [Klebsiella pneumoniae]SAQ08494.1 Uncharacterised protein [Klebsiella oxytoca]VCZ31754.1 hypothetical protein BANRA_06290 [Pseudomonas aeruginosa]NQE22258.1 hypothetical protein [Klebsiella pneumoniae subsp. pneumoniae]